MDRGFHYQTSYVCINIDLTFIVFRNKSTHQLFYGLLLSGVIHGSPVYPDKQKLA